MLRYMGAVMMSVLVSCAGSSNDGEAEGDACPEGTSRCLDNSVQQCVEGQWLTWNDCGAGTACRITEGAAACEVVETGGTDIGVDTDTGGESDSESTVELQCPDPTLELCQDINWLDTTPCGQALLAAMRSDPDCPCNALLAEAADELTGDIEEELVVDPDGGVAVMARVVPNPDQGLSEIDMPQTLVGDAQQAAMGADADGLSAEERALREAWEANGDRVESCREYVYEKYYDYTRFEDAVAGRRDDPGYIAEVAFGDPADPTAIGSRVLNGDTLKMRDGYEIPVLQAPEWGYIVPAGPDGDCYSAWTTIRIDDVFAVMPEKLVDAEVLGELNLRDARCYHLAIDDPGQPDTPAADRWEWHRSRFLDASATRLSLVELDAMYRNVQAFQQTMTAYMQHEKDPQPCCETDPGGQCCADYEAEGTSLEARLQELFSEALDAGCSVGALSGSARCSWSPAHFVESLRATFNQQMETDYQRCLDFTRDDFEALVDYVFTLPNGDTWPSEDEIVNGVGLYDYWVGCPLDTYTTTASSKELSIGGGSDSIGSVDLFISRYENRYSAALDSYYRDYISNLPSPLRDPDTGAARLPSGAWNAHHLAGNSLFGLFYNYDLSWGMPGVDTTQDQTPAELCRLGPGMAASFTAGGRAFGSVEIPFLEVGVTAALDGRSDTVVSLDGNLNILGETLWSPQGEVALESEEWLVNPSLPLKRTNVIPPPEGTPQDSVCSISNPQQCLKVRFSIAGIPMSVFGGVSGTLGLAPSFDGQFTGVYAEDQPCWRFHTQIKPSLSLDAFAALAVDLAVARVGVSCNLTLLRLALPYDLDVILTSREADNDLDLEVTSLTRLEVTALDGKIAAFLTVNLGLIKVKYSYTLIRWNGLTANLALAGYTFAPPVSFMGLIDAIKWQTQQ